jgi:hypothetical protein
VRKAPTPQRRAFWQAASQLVIEAKDLELRQGLDRWGDPLAALSQYTIEHRHSDMGPADPHAPPLQPAHGLSRTRSLFTAKPTSALDGVTCWWQYDEHTGASWGEILRIHRDGGPKLPKRDVIGLSPQSLAVVKQKAAAWWDQAVASGEWRVEGAEKEVLPTPAPKFMVETQKAYKPKNKANAVPKQNKRVSQIKINGRIYTLQSGSAAQIRRGIANKTFSGFGRVTDLPAGGPEAFGSKLPPGTKGLEWLKRSETAYPNRGPGQAGFGAKLPPRPAPPAPPAPAYSRAGVEADLGVKFKPNPVAQSNPAYTTVVVDVEKVHADLLKDLKSYVGPGGIGNSAIKGRYADFAEFLKKAKRKGIAIEQPRAFLDVEGLINLGDGRHRFAYFRDQGAQWIPVSVPKVDARKLKEKYGPDL